MHKITPEYVSAGLHSSRLGLLRFAAAYPEIDLRISAAMHHVDFAREDVDVAVRHGDGNWAGLHVENLCAEELFPVCSLKLIAGLSHIASPSDVLRFPLLHLDDRTDWSRWLAAAGIVGVELSHGPVLNHASMLIDAAADGQGLALARTILAAWDLITGRLVRPLAGSLQLSKTYWIVCPKITSNVPKIATFRTWLLAEAAEDARRLERLAS
jgi:LysR family glycine cleavage system transcriptional activator